MSGTPPRRRHTIRFALTKGEGVPPDGDLMSRAEKADPRRIFTFHLDNDTGGHLPEGILVLRCTVLYDGVSPGRGPDDDQDHICGAFSPGGEIGGAPCPIIEFTLNRDCDAESVLRAFWESSYLVKPRKQATGFHAEDWNGYTTVLPPADAAAWKRRLKRNRTYSGKTFDPKQLESGVRADLM